MDGSAEITGSSFIEVPDGWILTSQYKSDNRLSLSIPSYAGVYV